MSLAKSDIYCSSSVFFAARVWRVLMACNCSTAHAYSCKTAARANEPTGLQWGRLQINAATVECSQGCHRGLPGHHCLPSADCRLHSAVLALRQLLPSIFVVGIHEYARTTPWAATEPFVICCLALEDLPSRFCVWNIWKRVLLFYVLWFRL